MKTPVRNQRSSDATLWQLVCQGSTEAFEILVRRHQSLVSAVAYNACGNLALSEDIAQETFWAAWRERASLVQPGQLRPWLCGIARNLARNAGRRAARRAESAAALDAVTEPFSDDPGPSEEAVSREEETILWRELGQIPETHREPLILFYRENQSVAEVALALDLSEDAVKQRLSRGRAMLRERVAELVETGLRRSRPGRGFTVAVMAGLAASSAGVKASLAAGGASAAGAGVASSAAMGAAVKAGAGAGVASGVLGGLLGSFVGLAGGWLGYWAPAQMAPTKGERDTILRAGRRMLLVSVGFIAGTYGIVTAWGGRLQSLVALGVWYTTFIAYLAVESIRLARASKRTRAGIGPLEEPNDTAMRTSLNALAARYRGRVFRSRVSFLGLPLVDINVSDPVAAAGSRSPDRIGRECRRARGWIAVGDDAGGILLAVGSTARGFVAIGGRTLGVLSFGGMAVGLVSFGGLALGMVAIGGLGLGVFAFGGLAVGWWASGGAAVAWEVASGGFAAARHAAYGGAAFAYEYALGGGGRAMHFNDDVARALLGDHPLVRGLQWYTAHLGLAQALLISLCLLGLCVLPPLLYRRERGR